MFHERWQTDKRWGLSQDLQHGWLTYILKAASLVECIPMASQTEEDIKHRGAQHSGEGHASDNEATTVVLQTAERGADRREEKVKRIKGKGLLVVSRWQVKAVWFEEGSEREDLRPGGGEDWNRASRLWTGITSPEWRVCGDWTFMRLI